MTIEEEHGRGAWLWSIGRAMRDSGQFHHSPGPKIAEQWGKDNPNLLIAPLSHLLAWRASVATTQIAG